MLLLTTSICLTSCCSIFKINCEDPPPPYKPRKVESLEVWQSHPPQKEYETLKNKHVPPPIIRHGRPITPTMMNVVELDALKEANRLKASGIYLYRYLLKPQDPNSGAGWAADIFKYKGE